MSIHQIVHKNKTVHMYGVTNDVLHVVLVLDTRTIRG